MGFFSGTPERFEQVSRLRPTQEPLYQQLISSAQGPGAGGAFGTAADYYRGLLSNESPDINAFAAPELRRFNQQTIPGLAEQFAGMGSGALSSSGFRNAAVNAGADLSERLGAIRAQLRQQGAQGLQNLASQGLQQFSENIFRPPQEGFLGQALGPALGAIGGAIGGPALGAIGGGIGNKIGSWFGSSNPYGNQQKS
jgi:hypothetical protein